LTASPDFNGLRFGALLSLGGQPGNVTAGGGYSAGAAYANGPLALGIAYDYFKNPTGPFTTATPSTSSKGSTGFFTDNVSGSNALSGALNTGYLTANSYQVVAAGGTYAIGPALVGVSCPTVPTCMPRVRSSKPPVSARPVVPQSPTSVTSATRRTAVKPWFGRR
jgi:predicted porin